MTTPPSEMNPLQLSNTARSIASDAINIINSNRTGNGVAPTRHDVDMKAVEDAHAHHASTNEYWPFENADELITVTINETDFNTDPDTVNDYANTIKQRLTETTQNTDTTAATSTTESDTQDTPDTQPRADDTTDSDSDDVIDRSDRGVEVNTDNGVTWKIANDLYYCFLGDEDTSYEAITTEYDAVFPSKATVLTELMNTTGSTTERIRETQQWVNEWFTGDGNTPGEHAVKTIQ